jgi:hypothetical protein
MANNDEQHGSSKVHGDKLATGAGHTAAAPGTPGDAPGAPGADAPVSGAAGGDRAPEPGTGGLMPGNYEQGGGEGGHAAGERGVAHEDDAIRAPGSRVPHPESDPSIRQRALDIANGGKAQP